MLRPDIVLDEVGYVAGAGKCAMAGDTFEIFEATVKYLERFHLRGRRGI